MVSPSFDARGETDEDLLVYMSWKAEDAKAARAAFDEFYARHARYLFVVCSRAFGDDLGAQGVEDLLQGTFWQAYEKAGTFTPIGSPQDCKAARRRIRAWLGTIAQRLFLSDLRRRTRRIRLVTGEDERVGSCESREELMRPLSPDEELVRLGMKEALNDKEREVLLSYASYYAPERKCQQPPDGEVPAICQRLGMTEENLRQTRKRAMTKLGDFILSQQSRLSERGYAHVRAQGQ